MWREWYNPMIPQISWHSRDPVLSIDFQPLKGNRFRVASGGTDSHVLIWYVTYQENKSINIECASDLYRHNKSVNVVRFSPNGDLLASGDDEGALFVWQIKERDTIEAFKDEDNINLEDWYVAKPLRGHLEDIYDISWSSDGNYLVSASMDNTAITWDMQKFQKLHIFSDSKGYVQGVSWDPLNLYIASIGTDRTLRIMNINSRKTVYRIQRAPWSVTTEKGSFRAKLFYDDTLKSYFRRLSFTPDGELLLVPSGILEKDDKVTNTVYIFSRHSLSKPVAYLPTGDKYTVAVRCNPVLYKLRNLEEKENQQSKCLINLPYRMIIAVAACDSVIIYDTQQLIPIANVSNIHYTHLTDLSWSADGRILVASSTDGYCSFIIFNDEELGEVYVPPPPTMKSPLKEEPVKQTLKPNINSYNSKEANGLVEMQPDLVEMELIDKEAESNDTVEKTDVTVIDKKNIISPKAVKSPCVVKPKKPLLTIETFFKSPKTKPATITTKQNESSLQKGEQEVKIETSMSKEEERNLSNHIKTEQTFASCESEKKIPVEISAIATKISPMVLDEKMCDDSCSIEFICESKSENIKPSEKDPKYKVQLDFATAIQVEESLVTKSFVPDLDEIEAVSSFVESASTPLEKVESENDWKLELSQDEDIVPMDTDSVVLEAEFKNNDSNTAPKPKRRVNLITLSKTVSTTSSKF